MERWQDLEMLEPAQPGGPRLAMRRCDGRGPVLVWIGGLHSDMEGGKATALMDWARAAGRACLLYDHPGHGASDGRFEDGTISLWRAAALDVLDRALAGRPAILVGSSMGGWIALLAALARPEQVAGLCLIAPAPDFTEDLMWDQFPEPVRDQLRRDGVWLRPSAYGPPMPIALGLIEDGRRHLLLRGPIPLDLPVRIVHGQADPDVPWQRALRLAECLAGDDVRVHLVKAGGHRLSEPADLDLLRTIWAELAGQGNGGGATG